MEHKLTEITKNIITLISAIVIIIGIVIFCANVTASAQELDTVTLLAGTYGFNDVILPISNTAQNVPINFELIVYEDDTPVTYICDEISVGSGTDGIAIQIRVVAGRIEGEYIPIDNPFPATIFAFDSFLIPVGDMTIIQDTVVDNIFGTWYIANTNYNEVNGNNAITIPYTNVEIPTDIQIMENINMDINGFGSTTSNDNVGITALNGDTLGRLRTNDGTLISFNGIAVTSFDSWRPNSTYVYPLTDNLTAISPFTINNGLMLYVWDDSQYYQVAWYNPADGLWYVHGDYAIVAPYGHRSTTSIGTLTDGIAISLSITPNLSIDDIGYVELGGFEDTPPNDNIITEADEDAYSTFAMFCNANYISDSEKLSWGIAQHQSGQNLGQSQQLGDNILGQFLQAPIDILDSIVIYTTPNGTAVTLMGVFGALLTLTLVIIFLKLFAGG